MWKTIDRDPWVHAAVVTGAGRAFSAGGDLALVENAYRNPEEVARILEEARDLVYNILHCGKPIVSAINGAAVGAGLVVALLADISIASDRARLADGHVRMGVAAGDHAAIIWPLLCGMAKAKYYLLTSEFVSGEEAERIGLVSLCVPHDQLHDKTMEVATTLSTGPRYAIKYSKRALNQWLLQAAPIFDHSLALEMLGFFHEDMMDGVRSAAGEEGGARIRRVGEGNRKGKGGKQGKRRKQGELRGTAPDACVSRFMRNATVHPSFPRQAGSLRTRGRKYAWGYRSGWSPDQFRGAAVLKPTASEGPGAGQETSRNTTVWLLTPTCTTLRERQPPVFAGRTSQGRVIYAAGCATSGSSLPT